MQGPSGWSMVTSPPDEPGTVDDLITDAESAGYQVTVRLVRDWGQQGLLDQPAKRPAGKGHGSHKALYSANQRRLFRVLLDKRTTTITHITSLARIPVWLWLHHGDAHVPTRQVRRALGTCFGDGKASSKEHARVSAGELVQQLNNPEATPTARNALTRVLTAAFYAGRFDPHEVEQAARAVFEPVHTKLRGAAIQHTGVWDVNAVMSLITMYYTTLQRLRADQISDAEFEQARTRYRLHRNMYLIAGQQELVRQGPATTTHLYNDTNGEDEITKAPFNLVIEIGAAHQGGIHALEPTPP
jgi:hypothetical protein